MENRHRFANKTVQERGVIVGIKQAGMKNTQIAQNLGININTVKLWTTKFRLHGYEGLQDHRKQNSRPPKITAERRNAILQAAHINLFKSAAKLRVDLQIPVTSRTIRNCMNKVFINDYSYNVYLYFLLLLF